MFSIPVQTVEKLCTKLTNLIDGFANKFALPKIPAILLICASAQRPGLSAFEISAKIINNIGQQGGNVGVMIDGSSNIMNKLVQNIVSEMVDALKLKSRVDVAIQPGAITSIGTGGNAGGPVTVTSQNVMPVSANGILR